MQTCTATSIKSSSLGSGNWGQHFSESSFSLLVGTNCFVQIFFSEVGPKLGRDVKFCIGDLPEQKIANAHFSAGADQQFWIRYAARFQILLKGLFGNLCRV